MILYDSLNRYNLIYLVGYKIFRYLEMGCKILLNFLNGVRNFSVCLEKKGLFFSFFEISTIANFKLSFADLAVTFLPVPYFDLYY